MSKKNEFSDIVDSVEKKFKEIEAKKSRAQELQSKRSVKQEPDHRPEKFQENQQQEKFRVKEKLTYAAIAFVTGHLLLMPLYMKYPSYSVNMFIVASISLGIISIAIIDYS